jgi:anti-sigma factor RsiW
MHLNEDQLVAHYFHDDDAPAAAQQHLASCPDCAAQYESICGVLTLVHDAPVPERGADYGQQVWTRLRWKLGARRSSRALTGRWLATAAVLAVGLCTGSIVVNWRPTRHPEPPAATSTIAQNVKRATTEQNKQNERVLVLVVGDHLESSERMLTEVANADPKRGYDAGDAQQRAIELVASNRMYRQTAAQHGDERIASLLSDLEPILVELAHAGKTLSPDELASIQKRIESKGLLFKVRVMSAQNDGGDRPPAVAGNTL